MSQVYVQCPYCTACENHEVPQGKTTLNCCFCLNEFRVHTFIIPIYEKNKTTIEITVQARRISLAEAMKRVEVTV